MNIIRITWLLGMHVRVTLIIGTLAFLLCVNAQAQSVSLSGEHRTWLNREVSLIIGSDERDYFLSLRKEEARNAFVKAFWLVRDPTPGTARNEFREEHNRRLKEVNRRFGNMLWPGIATARGKVYMRLGEPVQIVRYESPILTSYMEAWLYPPDRSAGIRYNFYVLFYRPESKGDLQPFCPGADDPHQLLAAYKNGRRHTKEEEALREVFEIDPLLGQLSLSMLPVEHRPIMINNRFDLRRALSRRNKNAEKMVKTLLGNGDFGQQKRLAQIKKILKGTYKPKKIRYSKARVSIPYRFHVLRAENGRPRLLYAFALEGKRVPVADSYGKCYTMLEVDIEIFDESGSVVKRKSDNVSATLDAWNVHNGSPGDLIHQDTIDLPPGNYRINAEIRSPLDGVMYTLSDRVVVPAVPNNRLELSPPILLLNDVRSQAEGEKAPYSFFGENIYMANEQFINTGQDASFYYQLFFPRRDRTSTVEVRYTIRSGNQVLWRHEERLNAASLKPGGIFSRSIKVPSGTFSPGVYSIEIVAKALSPPEASSSADFSIRNGSVARGAPTLASVEREEQ